MSVLSIDTVSHSAPSATTHWTLDARNVGQTLELSESRTYDAALETLGAYKLTGNFPVDLEIAEGSARPRQGRRRDQAEDIVVGYLACPVPAHRQGPPRQIR